MLYIYIIRIGHVCFHYDTFEFEMNVEVKVK